MLLERLSMFFIISHKPTPKVDNQNIFILWNFAHDKVHNKFEELCYDQQKNNKHIFVFMIMY